MIVDDEFIMRQGIRFMMDWEKEGYEVRVYQKGLSEYDEIVRIFAQHIKNMNKRNEY